MLKLTNEKLVSQYRRGDEEALEILIKQNLKPIYNFVFRYVRDVSDADDITQEVFVKMWRNIKKFDVRKKFKNWLFTIARNTAIDFLRKKKVIPFSEFEKQDGGSIIDTLIDTAPLPDKIFEHKNLRQTIYAAVGKLSAKYQTVLLLYYKQQLNFSEIAESLNQSINTVKSNHRRALISLKKILDY